MPGRLAGSSTSQRRLARAAVVGLGVGLAFPPLAGAGTTGGVNIAWTAPAECPTSGEVSASVEDLLGRPPVVPVGHALDVKARAERRRERLWIGSVETRYGSTIGSRTFETESCRAAAEATALIVALMIDPNAVAVRNPRGARATESSAPAAVTTAALPPVVTRATPPTARASAGETAPAPAARAAPWSPRIFIGPTTAMDVGTLPAPTAGAGARVGVEVGPVSFDLAGMAWASTSATIAGTTPPAGGTFRFLSASIAACPTTNAGRFELGACGEAEVERVTGRGSGVSAPSENAVSWGSLGAGALARLRINRHLSIPLRLHALVPLAQPSFVLKGVAEEQGKVYSPARVLGRAEVGVDFDF